MAYEKPITSATSDNAGVTLRYIMVVIGGILLSRQMISQETYNQYIKGIPEAVTLILLVYPYIQSLWSKWRNRQRTETLVKAALAMPEGATKEELIAKVPPPPSIVAKITGSGKTPLPPLIAAVVMTMALGAVTLMASGCGTNLASAPISASTLDSVKYADRAFVLAGQAFDTAMTLAVELRAAHKIDNATWAKIDAAQKQVNLWSPKVATGLKYWRSFGSRGSFDTAYNEMMKNVTEIQAAASEAQR